MHKRIKDYNKNRDDYLRSIGIETLGFTNTEVKEQIENVLNKIRIKLKEQ